MTRLAQTLNKFSVLGEKVAKAMTAEICSLGTVNISCDIFDFYCFINKFISVVMKCKCVSRMFNEYRDDVNCQQ